MRYQEFKTINEAGSSPGLYTSALGGMLGALGSTASSVSQQRVGKDSKNQDPATLDASAKQIYIDRFVRRGMDALNTAVKQGLVDRTKSDDLEPVDPKVQAARDKQKAAREKAQAEIDGKPAPEQTPATNTTQEPAAATTTPKTTQPHQSVRQKMLGKGLDNPRLRRLEEDRLEEIYKRLTTQEKFKNALRKAGYDPDLAAARIEKLLAKHKRDREEREEQERKMGLEEGFPPRKYQRPAKLTRPKPAQPAQPAQPAAPSPDDVINPSSNSDPKPKDFVTVHLNKPGAQTQVRYIHNSKLQDWIKDGWEPGEPKNQTGATSSPAQPASKSKSTSTVNKTTKKPDVIPSMGKWLKDNFVNQFLTPEVVKKAEPQINKILKDLPSKYPNIKDDLNSIAEIGWALAHKYD